MSRTLLENLCFVDEREDDSVAIGRMLAERYRKYGVPATLAKHWDARAARALAGAMEEFPPASRVFLTRRLPETYLNAEDRRLIGEAQWVDEVRPQVTRLLTTGNPEQALRLLRERRGPQEESLLPELEIEVLEDLGELAAALTIAREQRRVASLANDPAGVTVYSLHAARLCERDGGSAFAISVLEEALAVVRAPAADRLRLLVALLGVWRRMGVASDDDAHDAYREEAADLSNRLGDHQIKKGVVADLARLAKPAGGVSWNQIVSKPRGETGRALLEVMLTFRKPPMDCGWRYARTAGRSRTPPNWDSSWASRIRPELLLRRADIKDHRRIRALAPEEVQHS